jgi:hypothetical protein
VVVYYIPRSLAVAMSHSVNSIGCATFKVSQHNRAERMVSNVDPANWACIVDSYARRSLRKSEKLHYLSSVQCALKKPALTPTTAAPGAVSRYDDLVATHINQTMSIHFVVCG